MAGPRPHGERVDGASIVGGAAGRPGGEQKRNEVSLGSWLANSPPLYPQDIEEKMPLSVLVSAPTSPGLYQPRPPAPGQALVAIVLPNSFSSEPGAPSLAPDLLCGGEIGSQGPLRPPSTPHSAEALGLHPTLSLKPWDSGQGRGEEGEEGERSGGSRRMGKARTGEIKGDEEAGEGSALCR